MIIQSQFKAYGETETQKIIASSGNRTRAARVAGEHSTTEPSMLLNNFYKIVGS